MSPVSAKMKIVKINSREYLCNFLTCAFPLVNLEIPSLYAS